ncbi:transposase [Massilia sp. CCM 8733]|uniref:Transposase n=1 Tax=Massilia mucilaginosa TaxID=2609282 RepID=A0ABX0NLY0_9BURK|nr:Rpn family recombination-promoting nuclease/putative transposase [Massilia mucilaginosa]NHZ87825.1 transposase [Massilia mucilaginosa]
MTAHHDLGYRSLFAHPELVRELIADFTPFKLLDSIALSSFKRVNATYVSERASAREADMVWRVQVGDRCLYVYLLLEFQSSVDRWMALRMQTYIGLLHQDLVKRHELPRGALLPPVLPLVFYNGKRRWSASTELAELLMEVPAELAPFQPSQRYVLIDQKRLDQTALKANANVLSLLFRLELSSAPEVLQEIAPALVTWLCATPPRGLRRSVAAWANRVAERRSGRPGPFSLENMEESTDMGRKFATWAEEFEYIGFKKGRAEGKAEGRAEGKAEGKLIALRAMLQSLLRRRFGDLPAPAVQRIGEATQPELEQWFERALAAWSLEGVFGDDDMPVRDMPVRDVPD